MFTKWYRQIQHRLTVYCMADYRGSRLDGYAKAMILVWVLGMVVIYL